MMVSHKEYDAPGSRKKKKKEDVQEIHNTS
jgi:hypothetical protein